MDSETATLTCSLSSILADTTVSWSNGDTPLSTTVNEYTVTPGDFADKEKTSELEIHSAKLKVLTDKTFKCSVTIDGQLVTAEVVTLSILG